jgi:5-methylcytosine-specific restriction endonuclease McrA
METRICSQCKIEKTLSKEFFNTRDKLEKKFRTDCKECQHLKQNSAYQKKREYYKQATKKHRKKLRSDNQHLLWDYYSTHPCVMCGETNPIVLELDHLGDKKYNISDIIYCHTWISVQKELKKCQVLCANCHKKKTAKDYGWYLYIENIGDYL